MIATGQSAVICGKNTKQSIRKREKVKIRTSPGCFLVFVFLFDGVINNHP